MPEKEKQQWGYYEIGQRVQYKDDKVFDMEIIDFNEETEYYTLRAIVPGETKDKRVPRNMMHERVVLPEKENMKYPVETWVNVYRNVYGADGKKTGEKKIGRGMIKGIVKGDGRYIVSCPISIDKDEIILVMEKTLDELNPEGGRSATDATLQIKTTRTTLQGGFGVKRKKS